MATPDPEFSGFTVEVDDQLPGRPLEGRLEIGIIFDYLKLLVTDEQRTGSANGEMIFDELRRTNAPVFGPNLGEFLCQNQDHIPTELRSTIALVFWGRIYRHAAGGRFVRYLFWDSEKWVWSYLRIHPNLPWPAHRRAVLFARKL